MTEWPPDDHKELQEYIVEELRYWNWDVEEEVMIDGNRRFRADIICEHDKWGRHGVEVKYIPKSDGALTVGKAIRQIIHQYRNNTFNGDYISKWLVAPYFEPYDSRIGSRAANVRSICCALGIGYIDVCSTTAPDIVFNYSNTRETKVPAAARSEMVFETDMGRIEDIIQGKVEYERV